MSLSTRTFRLALYLSAITLLAPLGCKSAGGQATAGVASDLSGPPVPDPVHAARLPRKCAAVTKPPSVAQAIVLVQCQLEGLIPTMGGGTLALVQGVTLQMGTPRAFIYRTDAGLVGIDVGAKIIPLRGSFTGYTCDPVNNITPAGHNCIKRVSADDANGWCWKTNF